jgi:hypothetical protein
MTFPFATTNRSALKDLDSSPVRTGDSLLGDKAVEEDLSFPLSHTSPGSVLKQRNNYCASHYQRISKLKALLKPPNIPALIWYNLKTIVLMYQQATASTLTMSSPEPDLNYKNSADRLAVSQFSLHNTKNTRSSVLLFPIRSMSI